MWLLCTSKFTFHYASTYTDDSVTTRINGTIYIPLCFYLYEEPAVSAEPAEPDLHSTMLLLIQILDAPRHVSGWNLHSTMLLLIRLDAYTQKLADIFTFHYASTYTVFRQYYNSIIYIFTFHYASTYTCSCFSPPVFFWIYIPLCFYLYQNAVYTTVRLWIFTFHYASTYTIYISASTRMQEDLHSTMLLLIRMLIDKCRLPGQIYIPLCFYLYPIKILSIVILALFTFHYASTYTTTFGTPRGYFFVFTFHYASTYTVTHNPNGQEIEIYIPLCFYLYLTQTKTHLA